MPRKNLLSLHEAIVVALVNQPTRIASFDDIAKFIDERKLYPEGNREIPLSTQIMFLATNTEDYTHLFEYIGAGYIRLRDSYADFTLKLHNGLDAILENHRQIYKSVPAKIRVKDEKMNFFREVTLSAPNIICITTKNNSGDKKFIYVKEDDLQGNTVIGIYGINGSIEEMRKKFDPIYHFLAPVSDSLIVNVSFFQLMAKKTLKPIYSYSDLQDLYPFKFSTSPASKENYRAFLKIQESYQKRISTEKAILAWKNENPV